MAVLKEFTYFALGLHQKKLSKIYLSPRVTPMYPTGVICGIYILPIRSMYGIFAYIYHKKTTKCRQIHHTWILWAGEKHHIYNYIGLSASYCISLAQRRQKDSALGPLEDILRSKSQVLPDFSGEH